MPDEAFKKRGRGGKLVKADVGGGEVYRGFREAMRSPDSTYSRGFLAYLTHLGDAEKAATTAKMSVESIRKQARDNDWDAKLQTLLEVREKQGQHAFAKQLNRLLNLTQAVKMRTIVDLVMKHICEDETAFRDFLTVPTKAGRAFSARALLELTKAMQVAHQMTYSALADQQQERIFDKKTAPQEDEEAPQLSVFKALTQLTHATQAPIPTDPPRDDAGGH